MIDLRNIRSEDFREGDPMTQRGFPFAASAILMSALLTALPLMSQVTSTGALIQGTVQDPTGAAIPGATITITNDATGVANSATTDEVGRYIFSDLKPA